MPLTCRWHSNDAPIREKLADSHLNLDHPVWVDDTDFDVIRHLHRIALPSPGGRAELAEICGHIASLPLDRGRPLWEMWLIEGLADTDAHEGGRLAVMTKVAFAYDEAAETRRNPRSDDNLDDNCDDSCCPSDAPYTTICARSCLVTASARSWQCGGQGFESP
jgi:hypothetical protein